MEITKLEGGGRVPPTPQGVVTPTLQGGTPVPTSSPDNLSGTTHTQKIESSMPQPGDSSVLAPVCGTSSVSPSPAASQLKAGRGQMVPDKDDIPSESGERCAGLAVPTSHSATNLINQKSVIVSCVVSPPSPTAVGGCPPAPPVSGGELSALTSGPHTDTDDEDTDTTRRAMGYKNAISNTNCSSNDPAGCLLEPSGSSSCTRPTCTRTPPSAAPVSLSDGPTAGTCSSPHSHVTSLLPAHAAASPAGRGQSDCAVLIRTTASHQSAAAASSTGECSKPKPNKTRLSQEFLLPLHGWKLPLGGGLRGGAPLPGETSAISNGTSGWGPPPANSVHSSGTGAWGNAPPSNNSNSAWGSAASNGIGNSVAPPPSGPSGDDVGPPPNPKLLNSGSVSAAISAPVGLGGGILPSVNVPQNVMTSQQQQPGQPISAAVAAPMPPSAVGQTTSWAAAAGKGLPPQPELAPNGAAANKPIEVLNSLREALYSPDGWGGQNVKQDTSWDVGGAVPEPSVPPIAVKQDAMQWQSPASTGRNDGTDLWKSNLSGVPPPPKPQPTTPWGNHTPAHPADYKTWGEPEDDNNGPSGGGNNGGPGPAAPPAVEPHRGPIRGGPIGGISDNNVGVGGNNGGHNWNDDNVMSGGGSGPVASANNQPWDTDPGKGKEDNWGNPAPSNQWGNSGQVSAPSNNMQMDGPRMDVGGGGGGGGWGAPPPVKPVSTGSWGGGGGQQPQQGGRGNAGPEQWHNESPSASRRMDDGGTSIWGGKSDGRQGGAPGGGWKDMPVPNIGPRAPPGPPTRMPPNAGPGMKPDDGSPWGHNQQLQGRSWGNDSGLGPANPWDNGVDKQQRDMGGPGGGMPDFWHKKPSMRTSPSWEDNAGGGVDARGWGGSSSGNRGGPPFTKETIWSSKQFRVLCDMNYRKS
jgi:hypothetical protein